MIRRTLLFVLSLIVLLNLSNAKILRNNALMSKMMTNFRNDNEISIETEKPVTLLTKMQNVLCKNFPSIPCEIITQDKTLRKLIEKSIQEINNKKIRLEKTTQYPGYLTLFPVINSEDISHFIQTSDFREIPKKTLSHKRKDKQEKKKMKIIKKSKRTSVFNRNKMRKFYPHKVKYKDKTVSSNKREFGDRSEDRLSMSVEVPDMTLTKKHQHFAYKLEPDEPPVWRIDYKKHGEPSINLFDFDNQRFKIRTGPNVIVNDNNREHMGRRDVLHPDLIINKNFVRKKNDADTNSEAVD